MKRFNTDLAALKIATYLIRMQNQFTRRMDIITSRYSVKKLKIILAVYIILLTGGCSVLIIHSFGKDTTLPIAHIRVPLFQTRSRPVFSSDNTLYNRVHSIRLRLDSLKQDKGKKHKEDSILLYRPGFYDSVVLAEKIIYSTLNQ